MNSARRIIPYAAALLLCLTALLARFALDPLLHGEAPLVTFVFAVLIAARYVGYGPGLAATALGGFLGAYFFLPPRFSLAVGMPSAAYGLLMFVLLGVTVSRVLETWRRAEAATAEQAEQFDGVIEAMPQGVIVVAPSGYITFANVAAANLFGLQPSHMVGRLHDDPGWSLWPLNPEAAAEGGLPYRTVTARDASVRSLEFTAAGLGGRRIRLLVSAAPLRDRRGLPDGAVFSLIDLGPYTAADDAPGPERSLTGAVAPTEAPAGSAPTRVLYLDHTAKLSGGEIAMLRLLESTDRARVHPVVLLAEDGPLVAQLRAGDVETHVLPLSGRVRDIRKDTLGPAAFRQIAAVPAVLSYALRVAWFARRHRIQILHTNSLKADLYGALAGHLAGIPVVWHVRDHIDPTYLPVPAVYAFRFLAQHLPAYVITNSQSTLDKLFLGSTRPSAIVPGGLNLYRAVIHDGLAAQELSGKELSGKELSGTELSDKNAGGWVGPVRVGIVGRLAPWKGQHVFLEAAAHLLAAGHDVRFLIVGAALFGEDDYEAKLRRQAEEGGATDRVEFLGFRPDVAAILGGIDILVHASTTPEPFGQVVIEGMAEGLPVVATDGGGVREIITHGENGLLVPMGDAGALAAALEHLLRHPAEAHRLGAAGYLHVRQHFTADQSARRVEKVYGDVLAPRKAAGLRGQPPGQPLAQAPVAGAGTDPGA